MDQPQDCLIEYLTFGQVIRLGQVNKAWFEFSLLDLIWKRLYQRDFLRPISPLFDWKTEYLLVRRRIVLGMGSNQQSQLGLIRPDNGPGELFIWQKDCDDRPIIRQISVAGSLSALLDMQGQVWTCGRNQYGQAGSNPDPKRYSKDFTRIKGLPKIKQIAAGLNSLLMIDQNGQVWGCGSNNYGQIGLGQIRQVTPPTIVPFPVKIKEISTRCGSTLFLDKNEQVWVCGINANGILGIPQLPQDICIRSPVRLHYSNIRTIFAGHINIIIRYVEFRYWIIELQDGAVYPIRGSYDYDWSSGPGHIVELFKSVSPDRPSNIWAAGRNENGECGLGHFESPVNRQIVPGLSNAKRVIAGNTFTLVLTNDDQILAFGSNKHGQCGLPSNITKTANPMVVEMPEYGRPLIISAGSRHSLILFQTDLKISSSYFERHRHKFIPITDQGVDLVFDQGQSQEPDQSRESNKDQSRESNKDQDQNQNQSKAPRYRDKYRRTFVIV